jgi:hypothetical protein
MLDSRGRPHRSVEAVVRSFFQLAAVYPPKPRRSQCTCVRFYNQKVVTKHHTGSTYAIPWYHGTYVHGTRTLLERDALLVLLPTSELADDEG